MNQDPLSGAIPSFPFMPNVPFFPTPFFSPFSMPVGPFDPASMMGMPGMLRPEQLDQIQRAVLESQKQQLTQFKKYVAEFAKSLDQTLVKIDEEIGKIEKRSSEKREKRP